MSNKTARVYVIKIDVTLAGNLTNTPDFTLTQDDIWQDSFSIETASSGTSSFDIGTAVIGQCKFTINNIEGDFDNYDFFNASAVVWLGLVGDTTGNPATQQYYRMGFYTVDEPQKANGLISLTLLDNMWKFDVPFSEVTINYPATVRSIIQTMCSYCGVTLSANSQTFHGYNFSITEAPKDAENMNCREMLQYLAMIGCNFCVINDSGDLVLKWYDVNATSSTTDVFELNQSTSFGTDDIQITGVKFVIDNTEYIAGTDGYVLELENPLVNASNVSSVLNLIWATGYLKDFTLHTFNLTTASDLAAEIGDKCKIKDYKGNYTYSWITLNTFRTAAQLIQCNAETPNRTLVKRYSKAVQAAVQVARQEASEVISNYDLEVQMMNELAVNALGGYEDYEDLQTGGRVWYLSNMPITKVNNVCSFESGSTVFKVSGSGFFVSTDGGTTWTNGYNSQTGKLVVNVLSAIGINFDWARGGTLTLGGYGNGNGVLSILNSSNVEKVHGDNDGVKIGATTGSKMHLTTNGEIAYYYDNAYSGTISMTAHNYGTVDDPDIEDTLAIGEFSHIYIGGGDAENVSINSGNDDGSASVMVESDEGEDSKVVLTAERYVDQGADDISKLEVNPDGITLTGDVYLDNDIHPSSNTTGVLASMLVVDVGNWSGERDYNTYTLNFDKGILTRKQLDTPFNKLDRWFSWSVSGAYYDHIIMNVGSTTATFPSINNDYAYEAYATCADGVAPPMIKSMVITGTTLVVTCTAVTAAQAGSGQTSQCHIKLREIR